MRKTLRERVIESLIFTGRKNRFCRFFAIPALAVCMLFFHGVDYCKKGQKRFVCALFIVLMFMTGNSFAYPVFGVGKGFVEANNVQTVESVYEDDEITLIDEEQVPLNAVPILSDEDVAHLDEDAKLHGVEEKDQYSLSDILTEDVMNEIQEKEQSEVTCSNQIREELHFHSDDWKLVLINKQHPIPEGYKFSLGDIITIKGTMKCDERIIEEMLSMMQSAGKDGVTLAICSPYRDLNYQKVLFNRKIEAYMKKGMSYMDAYTLSSQAVTVPGASEHQIGLAIDIVSNDYVTLDEGFADTSAGKWLAEHSHEYGFILRYPKGKEQITGIEFEPWHFRYVGKEAATIIMEEGITLEEFWDKYL